jgi:hypothetical protein
MAAPTVTSRASRVPAATNGGKMGDGYQALIVSAADPDVQFWEIEVPSPGIDGGDAIDTTTQLNATWRTMAPRALKTLTEISIKAAYNPNIHTQALDLVNVETSWTVHFPQESTLAFYGFLKSIEFDPLVEGTMPTCTVVITPTNWDYTNNVEAAPAFANPPPPPP